MQELEATMKAVEDEFPSLQWLIRKGTEQEFFARPATIVSHGYLANILEEGRERSFPSWGNTPAEALQRSLDMARVHYGRKH